MHLVVPLPEAKIGAKMKAAEERGEVAKAGEFHGNQVRSREERTATSAEPRPDPQAGHEREGPRRRRLEAHS